MEGNARRWYRLLQVCEACDTEPRPLHAVIKYAAPFAGDLDGLYRVQYDGNWYAFTQFEPLAARKAFPGFDEPRFKTPFSVTIHRRAGDVAIANEESISVGEEVDQWVAERFKENQPSPTYLVALAVGPLISSSKTPSLPPNGVRAYSTSRYRCERKAGLRFSTHSMHTEKCSSIKKRILKRPTYSERWTLSPFLISKRVRWKTPGQLPTGTSLLLIDPKTATIDQRRSSLSVIAHRIAHQWFGNMVTMPWWDDCGLMSRLQPGLKVAHSKRFAPSGGPSLETGVDHLSVMTRDAQRSARQIRQPVMTAGDVRSAFDGITYTKGSAVLSMLEGYLGSEIFAAQIGEYLQALTHGHATADDLIKAFRR